MAHNKEIYSAMAKSVSEGVGRREGRGATVAHPIGSTCTPASFDNPEPAVRAWGVSHPHACPSTFSERTRASAAAAAVGAGRLTHTSELKRMAPTAADATELPFLSGRRSPDPRDFLAVRPSNRVPSPVAASRAFLP